MKRLEKIEGITSCITVVLILLAIVQFRFEILEQVPVLFLAIVSAFAWGFEICFEDFLQ